MRIQRSISPICLLLFCCSWCAADQNLIEPTDDAPLYQLSNFRMEQDSTGNPVLAFDFKRTREGKGILFVRGKSPGGVVNIGATVSASTDSGTIRLKSFIPTRDQPKNFDLEVYLVQNHFWGGDMTRYSMVSNAVRLGNPGEPTKPRQWTGEEKAAYEKYLRNKDDDSAEKPHKSYPVTIDVPSDSNVVPGDVKIVPGTPLQACYAKKWNPIRALSENPDGSLNVRWVDYGKDYDCSMLREELIIKKDILQQLQTDPSAVDFSTHIDAKPLKKYPVSIAVPSHSELVPKDAKVAAGTKLQACYAGKWNPITALAENADGTLTVRWDDYGPAFDCSMLRDELIIRKVTLKTLMSSQPAATATQPPVIRTWTDATGKFKVKAKLVGKTSAQVTLLTDTGREITLPISKLSEADRKFLGDAAGEAENPFQ